MLSDKRRLAVIAICLADAGFLVWGAEAALVPGCPGACLTKGYETFTNQSWSDLTKTSASTSDFLYLLFRVYGAYNVAFGTVAVAVTLTAFRRAEAWAWWTLLVGNTIALPSAMAYDLSVGYIGRFEVLEYVGLALIYVSLAVTAPFGGTKRPAGAVAA